MLFGISFDGMSKNSSPAQSFFIYSTMLSIPAAPSLFILREAAEFLNSSIRFSSSLNSSSDSLRF